MLLLSHAWVKKKGSFSAGHKGLLNACYTGMQRPLQYERCNKHESTLESLYVKSQQRSVLCDPPPPPPQALKHQCPG